MAIDYIADPGVIGVVGCREWGSAFLRFFFVLEEGVAHHVLGALALLYRVGGRIATLAEFVFEFCHGLVGIVGGCADFLAA